MNEEYSADQKLNGLGGWLILIGIGVVFGPLRLAFVLLTLYLPFFFDGTWELVTQPSSEYYVAGLGSFLIVEIAVNFILMLASCYLAYLFFSKRAAFPRWFIGLAVFSLVYIVADALASAYVFPDEPMFDPDTLRELARSLITVTLWIPYMLISKRVAATFRN
jgi:hypothetical protein